MSFCTTAEGRLFYQFAGLESGQCLVLSHSLGSSSAMWQAQLDSLGKHYRLLLYDHRGHGRSSLPDAEGGWSLADFGSDLLCLLDELKIERAHFCGLSLGGMVGLWLVQHVPHRLDRMIVANTSAITEDPQLLRGRMARIAERGMESIVDDVLDRWFSEELHGSQAEQIERFRSDLLATPDAAYLATSEAICTMDLRRGLADVRTPTLVVGGSRDRATPPAWGERIASLIPDARFCLLDAAHLSNVDAARAFDAAVLDFLGAR